VAEGNGGKLLKLPDWVVAKIAAPVELAPRGLFLFDGGVKTSTEENWCQKHLADRDLYPFWKMSMWISPRWYT
jgi:hypothetical protein